MTSEKSEASQINLFGWCVEWGRRYGQRDGRLWRELSTTLTPKRCLRLPALLSGARPAAKVWEVAVTLRPDESPDLGHPTHPPFAATISPHYDSESDHVWVSSELSLPLPLFDELWRSSDDLKVGIFRGKVEPWSEGEPYWRVRDVLECDFSIEQGANKAARYVRRMIERSLGEDDHARDCQLGLVIREIAGSLSRSGSRESAMWDASEIIRFTGYAFGGHDTCTSSERHKMSDENALPVTLWRGEEILRTSRSFVRNGLYYEPGELSLLSASEIARRLAGNPTLSSSTLEWALLGLFALHEVQREGPDEAAADNPRSLRIKSFAAQFQTPYFDALTAYRELQELLREGVSFSKWMAPILEGRIRRMYPRL